LRWDDEDDVKKDRLFRDYDTVLKESAVLTTFGGVLFGFLLNISIRGANQLSYRPNIVQSRVYILLFVLCGTIGFVGGFYLAVCLQDIDRMWIHIRSNKREKRAEPEVIIMLASHLIFLF
jgi:hypothetical protein